MCINIAASGIIMATERVRVRTLLLAQWPLKASSFVATAYLNSGIIINSCHAKKFQQSSGMNFGVSLNEHKYESHRLY
jgi:hypothetical protein